MTPLPRAFEPAAHSDRAELSDAGYYCSAAALYLAACALGSWRLGVPSVWLDEAVSWYISSGPWQRLIDRVLAGDDMGGGVYAVLLRIRIALAGTSEVALRIPSVLLMLGLLVVSMKTARVLWGRRASLAVGALTVLHPSILGSARQARGYILVLLLTSLCLLGLAWQWAGRRAASRLLLGCAALLVTATHVFGVFVAAGAALASAALAWDRARLANAPAAARSALVALAPFVPAALFAAAWGVALAPIVQSRLETFWTTGGAVQGMALVLVTMLLPVLAGATGVALLDGRRDGRRLAAGALLVSLPILAGPIVVSLLARSGLTFATVRYVLPLAIVGTLVCGRVLSRLPLSYAAPVVVALALLSGFSAASKHQYSSAARGGQEIRDAAMFVKREAKRGDEVRVVPTWEWCTAAYYGVPYLADAPPSLPHELPAPAAAGSSTWTLVFNAQPGTVPPTDPRDRSWTFGTMRVVQRPR